MLMSKKRKQQHYC